MTDTLVQVHIIFRHGDKTPDRNSLYPKDPYKDEDYYFPYGLGQLTNNGKKISYRLGQILRNKYASFLGDAHSPSILDSWSSGLDRSQMSLQLVLASMFPPTCDQVWHDDLFWQPIAYKYDNELFFGAYSSAAIKAYEDYLEGDGKELVRSKAPIFRYMQENSGLDITTIRHALVIANALLSQYSMNLKLPAWTEPLWPSTILDLVNCEFDILASTSQLKHFTVGLLLQKIFNDTKMKLDGKSKYKMHLYSGHDITLAVLLRCFGISHRQAPSYCSNLILELHNIDGVLGFKVYHQNDLEQEAELLSLSEFGTFCPFDDFVHLFQDVLNEKQLRTNF